MLEHQPFAIHGFMALVVSPVTIHGSVPATPAALLGMKVVFFLILVDGPLTPITIEKGQPCRMSFFTRKRTYLRNLFLSGELNDSAEETAIHCSLQHYF